MIPAPKSSTTEANKLRLSFLRWQCRVRQIAMRDNQGRPDDAITPSVVLSEQTESLGHIITILNKLPAHSMLPELKHMIYKTNDPAQRREQAIKFLSATYYQKPNEFSDMLTATFLPNSIGASKIRAAETVSLKFDAYSQQFDLVCRVWKLAPFNPLYEATVTHNRLFNPSLAEGTEVLGFQPDWELSVAS